MADNRTKPTGASITKFLDSVEHPGRREDAKELHARFKWITGLKARMWGPSIVGYGSYNYVYESGHSGTNLATGFSPRKANMVLYVMPGYENCAHLLEQLGPHRRGKSCLYLGRIAKIDLDILDELILEGLKELGQTWTVSP